MPSEHSAQIHLYGIRNCDSCRRAMKWLEAQLSGQEKQSAESEPLPLLLARPTLINRPIVTDGKVILDIGFSPANIEEHI
jgi:arsenate reductase-like glutaredoxin family protein